MFESPGNVVTLPWVILPPLPPRSPAGVGVVVNVASIAADLQAGTAGMGLLAGAGFRWLVLPFGPRPGESLVIWIRQRGLDVITQRGRHIGDGAGDPAEPGHRSDRQQHVGDLVFARPGRQRPGRAPFQADPR